MRKEDHLDLYLVAVVLVGVRYTSVARSFTLVATSFTSGAVSFALAVGCSASLARSFTFAAAWLACFDELTSVARIMQSLLLLNSLS